MKLANFLMLGSVACCGTFLYYAFRKPTDTQNPLEDGQPSGSSSTLPEGIEVKSVRGILSLANVVGWFRNIPHLDKNVDLPFIGKAAEFKDFLRWTPTKSSAVFMGVYNEASDTITHSIVVEADALDNSLEEIFGNKPLVVLN